MEKIEYPIRINRYLALNKYSSRREADKLIQKGIVKINGRLAKVGDRVQESDKVEVDLKGKEAVKRNVYFAYYKPIGIVTHTPEAGQKSIREVAKFTEEVFPIGRLDRESHGLIIMTNDGRITDKMLNPAYDHDKEYVVKVNKKINNFFVRHMSEGIDLEGFITKKAEVEKIDDTTFRIILTEGKKHQIRRMCTALGYEVADLKRVRVMNIKLGPIRPGQHRAIVREEKDELLALLGL